MKSVLINTITKNYPVYIGNNVFKSLPEFISKNNLPKRVFVILDKNVEQIYGPSIKKVIKKFAVKQFYLTLASSEKIKSFNSANQIFSKLSEEGFGRDTLLVAIGGGTIGDLAGFISSTYMRGVSLIHIPTTLLSAVDSSIGGKTGINFQDAKNLIGTFYHPEMVLIDTIFLKSLPEKELISGFGEVIKYSFLTDKKFYSVLLSDYKLLMKKDFDFLKKIIYESIKIKSAVVSKDEKEVTGLRKILNFGHTFAHAYESGSSYKLSHGKAVIAGIVSALILSFEKKIIEQSQLNYMLQLPMKFQSTVNIKRMNSEAIYNLMAHDKKNRDGKIQFVLIKNFGEILVDVSVDKKSILKSLEKTEKIWFKRATAGL
ncbi:MAG: 3-dehydroquinate synthase [Ignavibacteria bacterium]|nr:3-dehydroquinate synthase [Ignavibacteria bacterium]